MSGLLAQAGRVLVSGVATVASRIMVPPEMRRAYGTAASQEQLRQHGHALSLTDEEIREVLDWYAVEARRLGWTTEETWRHAKSGLVSRAVGEPWTAR